MSLVRENLMTRQGYSPYCGNDNCKKMPRTSFTGFQFKCGWCGWESKFPLCFIIKYKNNWNSKNRK
jgi:hypothetical protein